MNDIEGALTVDFFGWARNGRHHTVHLIHRLMAAGVVFEKCSYSDTRCECDILFTFEGNEYVLTGGCGSTLDFHSVDKALDRWWSMQTDPPNVNTIIYRMLARLRGKKIDWDNVLPGQPLVWHRCGMPWPNEWTPPASAETRGQDAEGNS